MAGDTGNAVAGKGGSWGRWRLGLLYAGLLLAVAGFGAGREREFLPRLGQAIISMQQRQTMFMEARAEFQDALNGPGSGPRALGFLPHRIDFYPPIARRRHEEGDVLVALLVLPDGSVGDASVVQSSGYPQLDAAALVGVGNWVYIPAIRDHRAVPATVQVRVRFYLGAAKP